MLSVVNTLFTAKSAAERRPFMQVFQPERNVSLLLYAVMSPAVRAANAATASPIGFAATTLFSAAIATLKMPAPAAACRFAVFNAVTANFCAVVTTVVAAMVALYPANAAPAAATTAVAMPMVSLSWAIFSSLSRKETTTSFSLTTSSPRAANRPLVSSPVRALTLSFRVDMRPLKVWLASSIPL